MVTLGKYKILHYVSYLHLAGQDAHISFSALGGTANFRVRFLVGEEEEEKTTLKFTAGPDPENGERGLLTFTNWNKKDFRATSETVDVVRIGEKNIYLLYAISYDNSVYHLRLQFMEDTSELAAKEVTPNE